VGPWATLSGLVVSRPAEHLRIPPELEGERLDRALAQLAPELSRSTIQRLMDEGRVTLDGRPCTAKEKARVGSDVWVDPGPPPRSSAEPEAIPLDILFEDAHLIVLHKPAGLVVHPAPGHASGTLVNAILHHTEVELGDDPRRPGVVHRLDKDTSGVMVVARTEAAREGLSALFAAHDIEREYEALCLGVPRPTITYDTLIGRHPTDRKRFSSKVKHGKRAVTHVSTLEDMGGAARIRCRLETGRTHQIRVHLADHGHPLLADPVYGREPKDARLRLASAAIGRQALHARVLGFVHPITREPLRFDVAPPADFAAALEVLARGVE
jgi:23S rRNA pseudouridine1911/1915/1917 synthase